MSRFVYVVLTGEHNAGGHVVGVYRTIRGARKEALAVETCFPLGWVRKGNWFWVNGCDWVQVNRERVKP